MAIKSNFPAVRPSLLLYFANSETLDPRISFSRASTKMRWNKKGVLEVVPVNMPAIDYNPITGECKGLLIEEARTNLLTYSEQFDNAAWGKIRCSIAANATTAPDGTLTANKLVEDTTANNSHRIAQQVSLGAVTMCFSVRAKAAERTKVRLWMTDLVTSVCSADFDLVNGAVIDSSFQPAWKGGSATIRALGNGWFECALIATATQGASKRGEVYTLNDAGIMTYTGDGISGLYLWGAQLEAGSFPTSYIPTTSAQATRAADIAQMTGANFSSWYRQDEGTFVTESDTSAVTATDKRIFAVTSGSAANCISMHYGATSGGVHASVINRDSAYQYGPSEGTYQSNTKYKRALAYIANNPITATDGVLGPSAGASAALLPNAIAQLEIGSLIYSQQLNGHIARLTYYPKRLSNSELQGLSA